MSKGYDDGGSWMNDNKLKLAVMGINTLSIPVIEAAIKSGHYDICAIADEQNGHAEKMAKQLSCDYYDDYRQLLVQQSPDCLFVALPTCHCIDHLKAAIHNKCHILKIPPVARDFNEMLELSNWADENKVMFIVYCPWRFSRAFKFIEEFLAEHQYESIAWIQAHFQFYRTHTDSWSCDPELAGGGVLLHEAYPLVDMLLTFWPLPQQVFSMMSNKAHDRKQRRYLTENTAIVTCRFDDRLTGTVFAADSSGPATQTIRFQTDQFIVHLSKSSSQISDRQGRIIQQANWENRNREDNLEFLKQMALCFGQKQPVIPSLITDHLKHMAFYDAAYLSARTGFPEQPPRIFDAVSREKLRLPEKT